MIKLSAVTTAAIAGIFVFTLFFTVCKLEVYEWSSLEQLSSAAEDDDTDADSDTDMIADPKLFRHRVAVTVNNSLYSETLNDFPVLVRLDGTDDVDLDLLGTDPDKPEIRFYTKDLKAELAFEVIHWNPDDEDDALCLIWVKAPSVPAHGTLDFYLYYDYQSAEPLPSYPKEVWTNGFLGVWHLDEASGTSYADSSSAGHHGGLSGPNVSYDPPAPAPEDGMVGGAQRWETGENDGIAVPPISASDLGPFTVTMWVRLEDTTENNHGHFFDKSSPAQEGFYSRILDVGAADDKLFFHVNAENDEDMVLKVTDELENESWMWWSFVYDGVFSDPFPTENRLYEDGSPLIAELEEGQPTGAVSYAGDSDAYFHIGNSSSGNESIVGLIDEVWISSVVRSETWLKAQYANMTGTDAVGADYITFGVEEELF